MTTDTLSGVFDSLGEQGRLLSPIHSGPLGSSGLVGYRGELAVIFAEKMADEARPPELLLAQFMAAAKKGAATFDFLTGFLWDLSKFEAVSALLRPYLAPGGTYVLYANNVDFLSQYLVTMDGIDWVVLPLDESTVYNEVLDLLGLEKSDLKKLDTGGKLAAIAKAATGFRSGFKAATFAEALAAAGPVKDPREHRPV
jgi:hypothetical protein